MRGTLYELIESFPNNQIFKDWDGNKYDREGLLEMLHDAESDQDDESEVERWFGGLWNNHTGKILKEKQEIDERDVWWFEAIESGTE